MSFGNVRRKDKIMEAADARALLDSAAVGRTATVGADGLPYVVPNLFIHRYDPATDQSAIWLHTAASNGHFFQNATADPEGVAACFEVDEAGAIYPYGEFECSTSISYRSVVCFGTLRVVADPAAKAAFFAAFMDKYGDDIGGRPLGFFPRLAQTTVYSITIRTMTGKAGALPDVSAQWPAVNITKVAAGTHAPADAALRPAKL